MAKCVAEWCEVGTLQHNCSNIRVSLKQLVNNQHNFGLQGRYRRIFQDVGVVPCIVSTTDQPELQLQMVRHGLGFALVTEQSLGSHHSDLACVPLEHPMAYMERGLFYRSEVRSPALDALLRILIPDSTDVEW